MKRILLLLFFTIQILSSSAQDDKTVTLTVTGQSKTIDGARQNALRSAIEQAFGTFISSNTKILNDKLVNDEIVSVSNGNIQKYTILNEIRIPDGSFVTTINAIVSINKLTSFCENKGIAIEFKGALFALNMKMQLLNEQNEIKAIKNTCEIIRQISDRAFDYTLKVSNPLKADAKWRIPIEINVTANESFFKIPEILNATLSSLSLQSSEVDDYSASNKITYPITLGMSNSKYGYFFLRSPESIFEIISTLYYFNHSVLNFQISNGIENMQLSSITKGGSSNFQVFDKKFGVFLRHNEIASVFHNRGVMGYYNGAIGFTDFTSNGLNSEREPVQLGTTTIHFPGYSYESAGQKYFMSAIGKNYSFVKDVKHKVEKNKRAYQAGIVISFIGIDKNDKSLIQIITTDLRTTDEIGKITEYKIVPYTN